LTHYIRRAEAARKAHRNPIAPETLTY